MLLEMFRNFLLQAIVVIGSLMHKDISIVVLIYSLSFTVSLWLVDLLHHIGIGSFLTTFHISELGNIQSAL